MNSRALSLEKLLNQQDFENSFACCGLFCLMVLLNVEPRRK